MRTLIAVSSLMCGAALWMSCGSQCGLALVERIGFPQTGQVPVCCGASVYRDVNLTAEGIQVDLTNSSTPGQVDAFLTDGNCSKLFDTYTGSRTGALCQIVIGPVSAGMVSPRRSLAPGRYRLFAQAWSSNEVPATFVFDLGVWSDNCRDQRQLPL